MSPLIILPAVDEESVVDGVRMFIQEYEYTRRIRHLGKLEKLDVERVKLIHQATAVPHHSVHRHAANAGSVGGLRTIRGAFVNPCSSIVIR